MARIVIFILASVTIWLSVTDANGQLPYRRSQAFSSYGRSGGIGPATRPSFSPYLNLLRSGNSTLSNYYGLVRPELEFRAADQRLQSGLGDFRSEYNRVQAGRLPSRLPATGHAVQFGMDLQGGAGNLGSSLADRYAVPEGQTRRRARFGATGHSVYFNNRGPRFDSFNR